MNEGVLVDEKKVSNFPKERLKHAVNTPYISTDRTPKR